MKGNHTVEVLYEDEWLIVICKPSGMLSVGFPGYRGKSAQDILTGMHRSRGKIRIAVVHRLDRDTSGVMMYACSAAAKERIMNDWQDLVTERTYRCVCERLPGSKPLADSGTIDAPLAYNRHDVAFVPRPDDRHALKDAEKAVTHFRVLERGSRYDLVECDLETGRKNQIRAHLAHLGHPLVGDEVYGKDALEGAEGNGDTGPIGRLALHARILAFTHPFTGTAQRFEIPEPESFARLVGAKGGKTAGASETAHKGDPGKRGGASATVGEGDNGGTAVGGKKVPRRQRGRGGADKRLAPGYVEPEAKYGKERDIEDLTDLEPKPRRSRTRQNAHGSRFIPGKKEK